MADPNRPITAYPPSNPPHAPPPQPHAPPPQNPPNGFSQNQPHAPFNQPHAPPSQPHAPPSQPHAPPHHNPPYGFSQAPPPTSAYPYHAPPPQNYPYYHPYYNNQRATFLRRILSIIIAAFVFTASIIFIVWLILRPHLPQIRVDSLTLTSPFNLTSNRLSTTWDLRLTARNPNRKITLSYEHVQAAVFYKGASLADTFLPPFVQGRRNETGLLASFAAASSYVDRRVGEEIEKERGRSNGNVGFNVVLIAEVRLNAGAWRARRRFLKAYCGDLVISVLGNGSSGNSGLIGGPRQCRVDL